MYYSHIKNVFSPSQCTDLILKSESLGFEEANVRFYKGTKKMENVRNNSRLEFVNEPLLREIETSLISKMENSFPYTLISPKSQKEVTYTNLNPTMRFYRYEVGEYFKAHKDGGYQLGDKESLITLLLYLNDTDGGETLLMPDGPSKTESFISILPKAGDILLFNHNSWHEGKPVNSGKKYVLRSDIFYTTW